MILVHYARGAPFGSFTAHGPDRWDAEVAAAPDDAVWGRGRFADPDYLPRRYAVEAALRAEFAAAGGRPVRSHPWYAFVGPNPRWEAQDRPGMVAWEVPLAALPAGAVSFTFGDSLVLRDPAYRAESAARGRPQDPRDGRLVCLEELADAPLFAALEAQVWADPPAEARRARSIPAPR